MPMYSGYIVALDYALLPLIVGIVYVIAYRIRRKYYPPGHPWRKYFIAALTAKMMGAIVNGMIHYYYYGFGDTFRFMSDAQLVNSFFSESPVTWFNLIFRHPDYLDINYYRYTSQITYYNDSASYVVVCFAAVLGLFTFSTYLPTAVLFAFLSFSGLWALFRTFARLYPHLTYQIAVVTLFIPTTLLWGSAIYKDTLCMFALGWMTYGIFRFLVQKDFGVQNIVLAALSVILVAKAKLYILMAFLPALGMWILFNYTHSIKVKIMRTVVKLGMLTIIIGLSVYIMSAYSREMGIYSLDKIVESSATMRDYILEISEREGGSGYSLGEFPSTPIGMLSKFPQAVNVTLFRPYLWETKKVIQLFSAVEALLFVIVTLRVLFAAPLKRTWKIIAGNPTIQFCLIFTLIFAFAVGITTYNFGSLSRYKIPCLPFYGLALVLIYYQTKPAGEKILPPIF